MTLALLAILWLSASKLEWWDQCGTSALYKESHGQAFSVHFLVGRLRHRVVEVCYHAGLWPPSAAEITRITRECWEQNAEWKREIAPDRLANATASMVVLASKPQLWPARESIKSVEGTNVPAKFRQILYGNANFAMVCEAVGVSPWGVRGIFDLVYEETAIVGGRLVRRLIARDWKGWSGEYVWQARVYALAMSWVWPGYDEYVFEPVYIPAKCRLKRHAFDDAALIDAYEKVEALVKVIVAGRATKKTTAKVNRYCYECALRGSCMPYQVSQARKAPAKEGAES